MRTSVHACHISVRDCCSAGDYGVGDVISLLWFKRSLPKYATRFIDMCVMLLRGPWALRIRWLPYIAHTNAAVFFGAASLHMIACSLLPPQPNAGSLPTSFSLHAGAHNCIVTSRAGKDLVSCLVSGLLTIGPRFGGAIDDAARYFQVC